MTIRGSRCGYPAGSFWWVIQQLSPPLPARRAGARRDARPVPPPAPAGETRPPRVTPGAVGRRREGRLHHPRRPVARRRQGLPADRLAHRRTGAGPVGNARRAVPAAADAVVLHHLRRLRGERRPPALAGRRPQPDRRVPLPVRRLAADPHRHPGGWRRTSRPTAPRPPSACWNSSPITPSNLWYLCALALYFAHRQGAPAGAPGAGARGRRRCCPPSPPPACSTPRQPRRPLPEPGVLPGRPVPAAADRTAGRRPPAGVGSR